MIVWGHGAAVLLFHRIENSYARELAPELGRIHFPSLLSDLGAKLSKNLK